jgi:tetrahydromethanopterin S-methyltransferase subunit C
MGRTYAGILGVIAFLTVLVRGLIDGRSAETIMQAAVTSLVIMAVVGAIVGRLAAWLIEDTIRWQIHRELASHQPANEQARPAG